MQIVRCNVRENNDGDAEACLTRKTCRIRDGERIRGDADEGDEPRKSQGYASIPGRNAPSCHTHETAFYYERSITPEDTAIVDRGYSFSNKAAIYLHGAAREGVWRK